MIIKVQREKRRKQNYEDNDIPSIVMWKRRLEMEEEMQALTVRWNKILTISKRYGLLERKM